MSNAANMKMKIKPLLDAQCALKKEINLCNKQGRHPRSIPILKPCSCNVTKTDMLDWTLNVRKSSRHILLGNLLYRPDLAPHLLSWSEVQNLKFENCILVPGQTMKKKHIYVCMLYVWLFLPATDQPARVLDNCADNLVFQKSAVICSRNPQSWPKSLLLP